MRPDEHKRKKNTAYKKKHGINKTTDSAAPDKKSKPKDQKDKTITVNRESSQTQIQKTKVGASNLSDSSGSDSEYSEVVERKSYRRRDIVSNWQKYELEPEDDEPVTSKGEDFNKLLNMAGEAMAHFRFREELEWEDDMKFGEGDGAEHDPSTSSFLALNLADISSSMSCVPIHQLLGIDQSLFLANQLESHLKSVSEKRFQYMKSVNDRLQSEKNREQNKPDGSSSPSNLCSPSESNDFRTVTNEVSPESSCIAPRGSSVKEPIDKNNIANHSNPSKEEILCKKSASYDKKHTPVKESKTSPTNHSQKSTHSDTALELQDDELDQLLDMDVRQDGKKEIMDPVAKQIKNVKPFTIAENISSSVAHSTVKKGEKREAEELEDWLDSILD